MNLRKKGYQIEDIACSYLKDNGYEILQRNYYCSKYGEIDIIAKKDNMLVFIEVRSINKIEPQYTINPKKIKRLENCIYYYLSENNIDLDYRVEIIIMDGKRVLYHIYSDFLL